MTRPSLDGGVVAVLDPVGSGGAFGAHARAVGMQAVAVFTRRFHEPYLISRFDPRDYVAVIEHRSVPRTAEWLTGRDVVAVVSAFDTSMGVADELAMELGVLGNPPGTSVQRSNKTAMKQAWTDAGVACARWARVESATQAVQFASMNGLPVVVKPEESGGGFNVFVCHSVAEVEVAYHLTSTMPQPFGPAATTVLIEEFLDGDEYFVDLVHSSDSSRPDVLCLARYDKIAHGTKAAICRGFRSLPPDTPQLQSAIDAAVDANRAIGVVVGVNDTELKLTTKGPRIIEVNNRLPGALTPEMIQACTGISPYEEAIRVFSGRSPSRPYAYRRSFSVCCLVNPSAGRVTDIAGLEEIRQLPSHHSTRVGATVGAFAPETLDLFTAWGMVCLTNDDEDQLSLDTERVHTLAQLVTEPDATD